MRTSLIFNIAAAVIAAIGGFIHPLLGVLSAVISIVAIFVDRAESKRTRAEMLREIKQAESQAKAFSMFVN